MKIPNEGNSTGVPVRFLPFPEIFFLPMCDAPRRFGSFGIQHSAFGAGSAARRSRPRAPYAAGGGVSPSRARRTTLWARVVEYPRLSATSL